jgi:hypothetical protein
LPTPSPINPIPPSAMPCCALTSAALIVRTSINLNLQEGRQRDADIELLTKLQDDRTFIERERLKTSSTNLKAQKMNRGSFDLPFGK